MDHIEHMTAAPGFAAALAEAVAAPDIRHPSVANIHPTASIAPGARVAPDAVGGPWCSVGADVVLEAGVRLISLQKGFGSEQIAGVDFPVAWAASKTRAGRMRLPLLSSA